MKLVLALALSALTLVAPEKSQAGTANQDNSVGIVTFTVDNLLIKFFENQFPVFFEHEIPGTLYGQTLPIGRKWWDMDWDDVNYVISQGWEFGAHGYSHKLRLNEIDDQLLELELGAPAALIYRKTGIYPTTFATPFGKYNDHVLDRASLFYDAHLGATYKSRSGINPIDATDHFRINRGEIAPSETALEVCAGIEAAGRENHWLVLLFHVVVEGTSENAYEITQETFEGIVKCAADLREKGMVRVMTVKDALQHIPHTPKE